MPNATPAPPAIADTVAGYVELARSFQPQGAHYLEDHRGHLMFLKSEERPFVTADLIRLTTITGTEHQLKGRIASLFAAGYYEVALQIVPPRSTRSKIGGASAAPLPNQQRAPRMGPLFHRVENASSGHAA